MTERVTIPHMLPEQWFNGWAADAKGHVVDESSPDATRWGIWAWIHRHLGGKKKMDCPSVVVPFIEGLVTQAVKAVRYGSQCQLSAIDWHNERPHISDVNAVIQHVEDALNDIVRASTGKPVSREKGGTVVVLSNSLEEICMYGGAMRALIKKHNLGGDQDAVDIAELLEEACESAKNMTLEHDKVGDPTGDGD